MMKAPLMVAQTVYNGSSPWRLRPIWSHSWMMKVLMTITLTAYIRFSPWWLHLRGGSPERRKRSWRSPI